MTKMPDDSSSPLPIGPSRRHFLKYAALLAGSVGLQSLPRFDNTASAAITDPRAYAAGRLALELDGMPLDFIKSSEGGFAEAEVIQNNVGPGNAIKKHVANITYSDITLQCDPSMPGPLLTWISASLAGNFQSKNGAIITADADMKERSRLEFFNALCSELTIPACEAGSREPGVLTVKLSPTQTRAVIGRGSVLPASLGGAKQQKVWLSGNFRLQIGGLEAACARINKIEALTVKVKLAPDQVGIDREPTRHPAKLEVPDLVITLQEADAGPWYQWYDDFFLKGNRQEKDERPGLLELLAPDLKTVLLRVNFSNLGLKSFSPEKFVSGQEHIPRVKVAMYCEQMRIAGAA